MGIVAQAWEHLAASRLLKHLKHDLTSIVGLHIQVWIFVRRQELRDAHTAGAKHTSTQQKPRKFTLLSRSQHSNILALKEEAKKYFIALLLYSALLLFLPLLAFCILCFYEWEFRQSHSLFKGLIKCLRGWWSVRPRANVQRGAGENVNIAMPTCL